MTFTDAAERLLPARHLSRVRHLLDLLKVIARGGDDLAVAQRMALIAFGIRIVSAAIAFISQVILARLMGNFDYGVYVFVWVLAIILGNLSCLGFHTAVIRFLPQYRASGQAEEIRGLTWTARVFSMISATLVAGIGIATVLMLGDQVKEYYVAPLIMGAFALPMIALGDVLDGTSRANNWPVLALSPTYLIRPTLIILIAIAAFAWFGSANAQIVLVGALVATYLTTLGQFVLVRRRLGNIFARGRLQLDFKAWVVVALPIFMIEGFYFLLTNADVIVVGLYLPPERVAVYFAAAKIMALVHFVYFAVKAAAAPRFSNLVSTGRMKELGHFASQTTRWAFWPSLVVGGLAMLAAPLLLSLFGPDYLEGRLVMAILLVGILAKAMVGPAEVLLSMTGHHKVCAGVYALALTVNIGLNIALIPHFGIEGAAIATAVAMSAEALLLHITVRHRLGIIQFVGTDQYGRLALRPAAEV
ncbi:lipopolysaccharide biosynthesis protein [Pseudohoeflea suaedae]|uniref:Lipopolysaccharide biosynthesis protein n=1 Tax=Pseudohoeflea suaedae TaxID=877384 RepID=A0A4V3A6V9_9HYPH|nr:oligosaccharide flippase family protein [Pseudohoeflea suaedae]TDH34858.1 lipopolysaccharide biosynthesis protein [Pseudohoeflea suaedae]